jgi:hypothetical protein
VYHAITRQFWFEEPVVLQQRHLLDIRHLPKAHRLTLAGLAIESVRPLGIRHLEATLTRFGKTQVVQMRRDGLQAWVRGEAFELHFVIHPRADGHFLEVALWTVYPSLRWVGWALAVVMWLTVLEDRIYMKAKHR